MSSKNKDPDYSISEALHKFIKTHHLEKGLDEIDITQAWKKLMGNYIDKYTSEIILNKQTLYITLNSSVLREELSYGKQKIIKMLNEDLGKQVVKKIVFK